QVEEIWRIVWGIRIFNKAVGKGGAGIPNLAEETKAIVSGSLSECFALLGEMQNSAKAYAAVLGSPSLQLSDNVRLRLQDEYYNRLQIRVYLTSLINTLKLLATKVDDFAPTLDAAVNDANALVQSSETNPVPKSAIYPRFIALTERWDVLFSLHREAMDAKAL